MHRPVVPRFVEETELAGLNVRFDGDTPNVNGRGIIEQPIKFKCLSTNDAAAITVTLVNTDSTN